MYLIIYDMNQKISANGAPTHVEETPAQGKLRIFDSKEDLAEFIRLIGFLGGMQNPFTVYKISHVVKPDVKIKVGLSEMEL